MDKIPETTQFAEFAGRKRTILERFWYKIAMRLNIVTDRVQPTYIEFFKPGNEKEQDGNVRMMVNSSGDFVIQFRVSGTWTTVETTKGS